MDNSISYYFAKGLAPSTHKAYSSAQNRYLSFCTANQLQPILLSEVTLCQFVTELANSSLKHQSIKCYLSGIRLLQISAGLDDPFTHTMPRLKLVLRGVKRHQAECGTNSRRRLPITPSIPFTATGCPATQVMMCQCSGQRAAYASLVSFGQGRYVPRQTHRMTRITIDHQVISHPTIPPALQSCGSILNSQRQILFDMEYTLLLEPQVNLFVLWLLYCTT